MPAPMARHPPLLDRRCCRVSFRRARRCRAISTVGATTAPGNGSMRGWWPGPATSRAERRHPASALSTAKACRRPQAAARAGLTPASASSRDGAGLVLDKIRRRFPWLELIWADGGYNAWQVDAAVAKVPLLRMEIVKRSDDMKGFVVLPRRWVVERTFSWFGRNRRLAKDFENLAETLATFVTLASIQLALRRLARA